MGGDTKGELPKEFLQKCQGNHINLRRSFFTSSKLLPAPCGSNPRIYPAQVRFATMCESKVGAPDRVKDLIKREDEG